MQIRSRKSKIMWRKNSFVTFACKNIDALILLKWVGLIYTKYTSGVAEEKKFWHSAESHNSPKKELISREMNISFPSCIEKKTTNSRPTHTNWLLPFPFQACSASSSKTSNRRIIKHSPSAHAIIPKWHQSIGPSQMQNVKRREKRENQPRLLTRRRIIENSYARFNRLARDYRLEASKVVVVYVCVCVLSVAARQKNDFLTRAARRRHANRRL